MSRAYRIEVKETLEIKTTAHDRVESKLQMLGLLPPERMAEILGEELVGEGFGPSDSQDTKKGLLQKRTCEADGTELLITVDPQLGSVLVETVAQREKTFVGIRAGVVLDTIPLAKEERKRLQNLVLEDAKAEESREQSKTQKTATNLLEGSIADIRALMDQVVHRATLRALREKASQMGQIRSIDEDPLQKRLTIVLEV